MSQGCRPPGKVTSDGTWTLHIGPHVLLLGHSPAPPPPRGVQITSCQPSPALPHDAHALGAALLGVAVVQHSAVLFSEVGLVPTGLILVSKDQHADPRDPRGIWPCRAQGKQTPHGRAEYGRAAQTPGSALAADSALHWSPFPLPASSPMS